MSCWDTSALLKLYLPEADSPTFERLARTATRIVVSAVTRYEAESAFRRKESEGQLQSGDADAFTRQFAASVSANTVRAVLLAGEVDRKFTEVLKTCLASNPPVLIRSTDALHIATALAEREAEFVTADARQRAAAKLVGLRVVP